MQTEHRGQVVQGNEEDYKLNTLTHSAGLCETFTIYTFWQLALC